MPQFYTGALWVNALSKEYNLSSDNLAKTTNWPPWWKGVCEKDEKDGGKKALSQIIAAHGTLNWRKFRHVNYVSDLLYFTPHVNPRGGDLPDGMCSKPTLMLRRARETHTHMGNCTQTSKLALNGWQLSLTYSSDTICRRFFLKWYLYSNKIWNITCSRNAV